MITPQCRARKISTYLIAVLCIKENPAKLYHLCRIFGDIDSMLITSGSNMDDNVSIQIALLALGRGRHFGEAIRGEL